MFQQAKAVLHFHPPSSSIDKSWEMDPTAQLSRYKLADKHVLIPPSSHSTTSSAERKCFVDSVLSNEVPLEQVHAKALEPLSLTEAVLEGKSAALIASGTHDYNRQGLFQQMLEDFDHKMKQRYHSVNWETKISYACVGLNDNRCVDLINEKSLTKSNLAQGITECQYEPVEDIQVIRDKLAGGFSTPGFVLVVRLECIPVRMMVSIDGSIDKNGNVFQSIYNNREAHSAVSGKMILVDLASSEDHMQNISSVFDRWVEIISNSPVASMDENLQPFLKFFHLLLNQCYTMVLFMNFDVDPESKKDLLLAEEFRRIRLAACTYECDERIPVLWRMEQKYKQLKKTKEMLEEELDCKTESLTKLESHLKTLASANEKLTAVAKELKSDLEIKVSECFELRNSAEKSEKEFNQKLAEKEEQKQKMENLFASEREALVQNQGDESSKLVSELSQVRQELAKTEADKIDFEKEMKSLQQELKSMKKENDKLQSNLNGSEKLLADEKEKVYRLDLELATAKSIADSLRSTVEQLSSMKDGMLLQQQSALQKLQEEQAAMKAAHAKMEAERSELRQETKYAAEEAKKIALEAEKIATRKAREEFALLKAQQDDERAKAEKESECKALMKAQQEDERVKAEMAVERKSREQLELMKVQQEQERFQKTYSPKESRQEMHKPARRDSRKKQYVVETKEEYDEDNVDRMQKEKPASKSKRSSRSKKEVATAKEEAVVETDQEENMTESNVPSPVKKSKASTEDDTQPKKRRRMHQKKHEPSTKLSSIAPSTKPGAPVALKLPMKPTSGVINPIALQMIKNGFTLPRISK